MFTIFFIIGIFASKSDSLPKIKVPTTLAARRLTAGFVNGKRLPEPFACILRPEGFIVSISAQMYDIRYVEFFAIINKPFIPRLTLSTPVHLYQRIDNEVNGQWIYTNRQVMLKHGYNVTYWLFVSTHDRFHFCLHNHGFTVTIKDGQKSLVQY